MYCELFFNHSIVSLHLCKENLTAEKLETLFFLQIKYWTFWYMDYSALIKSNTLENAWNGRNRWMVNNGWVVILVKCGFSRLLQRIFNCDKCKTSILLQVKYWTVWHMDHLSASSYTRATNCQIRSDFSWLKLICIFCAVSFSKLMPRIFKYGDILNISFSPDK